MKKRNTALFIDGENISAKHANAIMKIARKQGEINSAKVYGRQCDIYTREWSERAKVEKELKDIRLCGGPEKDKVDRKIQKDALIMSKETKNVDIYIFATSDQGYVPVIEKLRGEGKRVIVIGEKKASKYLRDTCSKFYEVDCN